MCRLPSRQAVEELAGLLREVGNVHGDLMTGPAFFQADNSITMGLREWVPELEAFHDGAYRLGFVLDFDWMEWLERSPYEEQPELVAMADIEELCKLLTAHVRSERFCDGHLAGAWESGDLRNILSRLEELAGDGS